MRSVGRYRAQIKNPDTCGIFFSASYKQYPLDAVWWSIAYRSPPHLDAQVISGQYRGHERPFVADPQAWEDSNLLINATLRSDLPPVSPPAREFMEHARHRWEGFADKYGLPPLRPEVPWHGYIITKTEWTTKYEEEAQLAVQGRYFETGGKLGDRAESTK